MSGFSIEKKTILKEVEEISISKEKVLVRGADKVIKEVDKSSFGGGSVISVTKSELDDLINNNSLIPGAYYKISGVHPSLYDDGTSSGTTIYLRASTVNTLEKNGHGLFYNPKYDQSLDGFGIWSNIGNFDAEFNIINYKVFAPTGISPSRITIDSNNNIFVVTNSPDNRVTKITPDGVSSVFNSTMGFSCGIAVDSKDNVLVTDITNSCLIKILADGSSSVLGSTGNFPIAIALDSSDNAFVVNLSDKTVTKITPNGTSSLFAHIGYSSNSITVDINNNVYVPCITENIIYKITPDGAVTTIASGIISPSAITAHMDNVYVICGSLNNQLASIASDGSFTIISTIGEQASNLTYTNGFIYTAHAGMENIISQVDLNTGTSNIYNVQNLAWSIISDSSGALFTSNMTANSVSKLTILKTFFSDEPIISNNGATGVLKGNLENGKFIAELGNWSKSTSITGTLSGATATIRNVRTTPSSIGSKTIWGGYSWTNNSGAVEQYYDQFTLSSDWTKDVYDLDNYNPSLDIIEYDYPNNWISRRYEVESECDVKSSYSFGSEQIIKSFMFGNGRQNGNYKGMSNITVDNAYFENINFRGSFQNCLYFKPKSFQYGCTFETNTRQENVSFEEYAGNSYVVFNENSGQTNVRYDVGARLEQMNIPSGFQTNYINFGMSSGMREVILPTDGRDLWYKNFEKSAEIRGEDLSNATTIFDSQIKSSIYQRPDRTIKIRYYDNDDNLVITDITD